MTNNGVVYTKHETVEFMLDLLGYTPEGKIYKKSILEPCFGRGSFIKSIVERLISSVPNDKYDISNCIRAIEIDSVAYAEVIDWTMTLLLSHGYSKDKAFAIVDKWFVNTDYLSYYPNQKFDFVCGNPPYIRGELANGIIDGRFGDLSLKADLYIPFFLKTFSELNDNGVHCFICSDRWMKNNFGKILRNYITQNLSWEYYLDLYNASPFEEKVTAYPAITLFKKKPQGEKIICAHLSSISKKEFYNKQQYVSSEMLYHDGWTFNDGLNQIRRRIESNYPLITEAGCKIGIGIATGADKIFLTDNPFLVEPDRIVPVLSTRNRIRFLINPWNSDRTLIKLEDYPKTKAYFEDHKIELASRHCAKKHPDDWFRTIDKIVPGLLNANKLLICDLGTKANISLDLGKTYPHHNLYYITSEKWNLVALKRLLESNLILFMISCYSVRMNSGTLRFQAQNIKRLHIPEWDNLHEYEKNILLSSQSSAAEIEAVISKIYNVSEQEYDEIIRYLKETLNGQAV